MCTINIGGLSQHKVNMVSWYLLRHKVDVCFLIDVRLTVMESSYRVKEFKQRLGTEIYVGSTLHSESKTTCGVGGQLVIVTQKWKQHLFNKSCDESGLGLTLEVYFRTGSGKLLIQGTYWPYHDKKTPGPNSLHATLNEWLRVSKRGGNPLDWIQKKIGNKMTNHLLSPGNSYILAGDLNKTYDNKGKGLKLKKWADDLGLKNPVCEYNICKNICLYTRYTGTMGTSHIDQIF